MGGCVAMNIHGKNCFRVGPFGDHVIDLDLLTTAGERITCSRQQRPDLFRAVIAGLGLLGAVTRVKLKLKHVESGMVRVRPIRTRTFAEMFDCFEQHLPEADYLVGWVDCFARGAGLGRGIVHRADYIHADEDPAGRESLHVERQGLPDRIMGLPRGVLWRLMRPFTNDPGMKLINSMKYLLPDFAEGPDGTYLQSHVAFAFLLDYVPNWRRAYGDAGFIQYQAFAPHPAAKDVLPELIRLQQRAGIVSYLGVFKRHRPDEFLLSHGLDGWSFALDIPVNPRRAAELHTLTRDMTRVVLDAGGTFYAAKDAVLEAGEFERAYGDRLRRFLEIKRSIDPEGVLLGDQGRRLMPVLAAS
jgi:FAD/FMN-containing dehydrogenase